MFLGQVDTTHFSTMKNHFEIGMEAGNRADIETSVDNELKISSLSLGEDLKQRLVLKSCGYVMCSVWWKQNTDRDMK
jgi:hypothetical protein